MNKYKNSWSLCFPVKTIAAALLWLAFAPTTMAQTLHLASNEKAVEQVVAARVLQEIYARIGLTAVVEPLPGNRANKLTVEGRKDGEVGRITPYAGKHPPLLRVDPPYYYLKTAVFAHVDANIRPKRQLDLAPYKAGVVLGILHAADAAAKSKQVLMVASYEQLYRLVAARRIDIAIDTGINGLAEIRHLGLAGQVEQTGVVNQYGLHNILHPDHAALRPIISAIITEMKDSGELDVLIKNQESRIVTTWKTN